jgi:hypothetical protein
LLVSVPNKSNQNKKAKRNYPKNMGVTHASASPGPTIHESNGAVWRLGFNDQDAKGRLEELVRSHILRTALKSKRALGGEDGQEIFDSAESKINGGHYLTFRKGWVELLQTPEGGILLFLSLLQEHHPKATVDDAERLLTREQEQADAAFIAVCPDFLTAMAVQKGESPANAPELAAVVARKLAERKVAEPGSDTTP